MDPGPQAGRCFRCGEPRWQGYTYCPRCGTGYAGWPTPRAAGFGVPNPDQSGRKTTGLVAGCVVVIVLLFVVWLALAVMAFGGFDRFVQIISSPYPYPGAPGFPFPTFPPR